MKTEAKGRVQDGAKVKERRQDVECGEEKRRGGKDRVSLQFCWQILCFFSLQWFPGLGLLENQHFSLQLL